MSAADYSWGAGDVLGKLRAAEAALSRVKALAESWEKWDAYARLNYGETTEGTQYAAALRKALGGAA